MKKLKMPFYSPKIIEKKKSQYHTSNEKAAFSGKRLSTNICTLFITLHYINIFFSFVKKKKADKLSYLSNKALSRCKMSVSFVAAQ